MKFALVFAAVLAVSAAQFAGFPGFSTTRRPLQPLVPIRPTSPPPRASRPVAISSNDQNAEVLRYNNNIGPDGSFSYDLETSNGIAAQAQGTPRDFGGNPPVAPVVIQGSYIYTSPEGQRIEITYTADENGFQAAGDTIPTSPPIPEEILKSLAYISKTQKK